MSDEKLLSPFASYDPVTDMWIYKKRQIKIEDNSVYILIKRNWYICCYIPMYSTSESIKKQLDYFIIINR